ncbi:TetR/AcrR family transcriptional regulator [Leptospira gomenensis]|uniref:TetR/AcrR family transcriptional regulator n=1 Tax=Leptospira gomenensis TaxID=2484974 RepID=A0A5F1YYN4_9LEPT|nr:TetR/AcrR family transcriptional regulator [Leptospira gomenensis]TGK29458.1 TetR/AcrR family transcriptional regulator [Leptospira gomenensis]TGK33639.1 TetR/AcrR family transcriptional regulator [Leptospira gomenensis]TGK44880.1 TetR/AcrR family transcriptional regulator [Leptospira gomenensis]TGK64501.1 TetR/AcrR family transcriptional regulator [Leptospira gomenensis]
MIKKKGSKKTKAKTVLRGRPRSSDYEDSILKATFDLLATKGFYGFSIEDIVEKTGVARTTIYRRWPSKANLAMNTILTLISPYLDFPDEVPLEDGIVKQMKGLAGVFQGDYGNVISSVIGAAQDDPELAKAVRDEYLKPRRKIAADYIKRAMINGEFPDSTDSEIEGLIDLLYGGLYFRMLLKHKKPGLDGLELWIRRIFRALRGEGEVRV